MRHFSVSAAPEKIEGAPLWRGRHPSAGRGSRFRRKDLPEDSVQTISRVFCPVAETALAIDRVNPQIAARLMGSFNNWRMLESGRRGHAKAALENVAGTEGLSRDVYEIVTKTLD